MVNLKRNEKALWNRLIAGPPMADIPQGWVPRIWKILLVHKKANEFPKDGGRASMQPDPQEGTSGGGPRRLRRRGPHQFDLVVRLLGLLDLVRQEKLGRGIAEDDLDGFSYAALRATVILHA